MSDTQRTAPRAFIFDCDGTLIDSMGMWLTIYPELVARYGISMTPEDFAATESLALPDEIAYYHEKLGIGESAEALIAELRGMLADRYAHTIPLREGVAGFLEQARAAGIPMAIATSTDEDLVRGALVRLGIDGFFPVLVTTAEAGASKEHPDVYDLALERLCAATGSEVPGHRDVWVFEDAMFGLASSGSAGYRRVGVYDPHGRADREVVRSRCEIFVDEFSELSLERILSFTEGE